MFLSVLLLLIVIAPAIITLGTMLIFGIKFLIDIVAMIFGMKSLSDRTSEKKRWKKLEAEMEAREAIEPESSNPYLQDLYLQKKDK